MSDDKAAAMTYKELMPFTMFGWLLTAAQKEKTDEWLAKCVGGLKGVTVKDNKKGSSAKAEKLAEDKERAKRRKLADLLS